MLRERSGRTRNDFIKYVIRRTAACEQRLDAALESWRQTTGVQLGYPADHGAMVTVGGQPIRVTSDGETLSWTTNRP